LWMVLDRATNNNELRLQETTAGPKLGFEVRQKLRINFVMQP
jgi:hypothetical protein